MHGLVHRVGLNEHEIAGLGKEVDIETLVAHIEREIAPIEVAVFNVGANVRFSLTETTERVYRKVWEMGALGGFLMGREVARALGLPRRALYRRALELKGAL